MTTVTLTKSTTKANRWDVTVDGEIVYTGLRRNAINTINGRGLYKEWVASLEAK